MSYEILDVMELAVTTETSGALGLVRRHKSRPLASSIVGGEFEGMLDTSTATSASIGEDQIASSDRMLLVQQKILDLDVDFFDDYQLELPSGSRQAFECFMQYNPQVAMPLLGAESTGALIATWRNSGETLTLRFIDRFHLDFAITLVGPLGLKREWGKSQLGIFFAEHSIARRIASS